jgi:hypothetical protein
MSNRNAAALGRVLIQAGTDMRVLGAERDALAAQVRNLNHAMALAAEATATLCKESLARRDRITELEKTLATIRDCETFACDPCQHCRDLLGYPQIR